MNEFLLSQLQAINMNIKNKNDDLRKFHLHTCGKNDH